MSDRSAIIVGAGLAGQTAALSLAHHGFTNVRIYEKSTKVFNPVGAGIAVQGACICLDRLGLTHVYEKVGMAIHKSSLAKGRGKPSVVDMKGMMDGTPMEGRMRACHRNLLMTELFKEIEKVPQITTKLGATVVAYESGENNATVTFDDGTSDSADIVVCSDGIHSVGRQFVEPDCAPPVHSGLCVFYSIVPNIDAEKFPYHTATEVHLDMGMALCMRLPNDDLLMVVGHPADEKWNVNHQDWNFDVDNETFHQLMVEHNFYKEQDYITEDMVKRCTNLSHLGIYQQPHVSKWSKGNVILIGDAAHATSPFMGQGANQAMLDGYYLGQCLKQSC